MSCTACGHENRPGRKFCGECGAALALACAACSTPYEAGEKFCGECGAALGPATARRTVPGTLAVEPGPGATGGGHPNRDAGARKVVTIVFADLVGSTALHERVDAESARRLMERYYLALRRAVEAHGGTVVKLLGDGVMAAFGLRRVAEDDALRAVRAAAAMQDAFRALVRAEGTALATVGLRVAVNTGEVVVAGDADDVIGDPVNVAARLQEQGADGDVVLGETTHRLVATRVTLAPLGSITLKGRAEAVAAHRLVSLEPPAGAAAAPFVGRDAELARLEGVLDAAVTTPATRLAVLVGSPGLGKSRLIDELARRHANDATILAAHCDAAGGATFAPLAEALRRFLGLADGAVGDAVGTAVSAVLGGVGDDPERARIAAGIAKLLGGSAMSPEETFFVVRRFLAALAASQPVVLVIDDLHWGEPLLFDLVEHLVQWGSGVPVFVLVGARPELRELRSSLVQTGGVVADVVVLGGLDAGAAMRLAAGVIGAADLPAAVAAKVLATSEGNPLFVGELVRMLVQEGALAKEGDRWTVGANLAALEMPPTIHALLAARIERLRAEDRTVLERAAVVGRHFSRSAVAALLGANGGGPTARDASDLDGRLEALRRSELIERDTGWLLGEPVLRFHHVLIRDAAYRRLLKGTRAELHARLADWIEGQVGDAPEHDEMVGRHLEQAHQLLSELGALDAAGAELGERAARRLAAAGRRALARDDVSLAAGLLGRATERLGGDAPERADLVLDWCEALLAAGDVGPAADAIAELDRLAGDTDRVASDASKCIAGDAAGRSAGAAAEHAAVDAAARSATDAPNGTAASARLRAWHTCFAGQLIVLTAPEALHEATDRVGAAARALAALDDAAGEAKAHFVHAQALARLGKIGACEAALDLALAAARRAGDRRRANAVLAGAPLAALWGPSPVTRASGRCLDVVRVLRITQGAPAVEAVALSCQGVLEALRGRTEAARRMLASSRTMVEELGISHRLFETEVFAGRIDLLEGDAAVAERALRAGYDGLRGLGLGIDAARAAALLGRALLAQDRAAEAETLSHESELLAGDDLQAAIAWRGVRAEALARRGDHATAIALAEAAVAIAAATDALLDHADARLALAAALRAAGRGRDADAEERRAIELWEAKGATVLVERTRRTVAPVAAGDAESQPPRPTAVRRRITPNRASRALVAFNAAMAAPDFGAFRAQMHEDYEELDHPTGASYGRDANVAALERLMRSRDASCQTELLATLGDALVLGRRRVHASATGGGRFDVGEYAQETYSVAELGADGRWCRHEVFGADHLLAAVARLFERHAELLPDGPERDRATASARAVALHMGPIDPERWAAGADPSVEHVDHRKLGSWNAHGKAEYLAQLRWQTELATGFTLRMDDVLAVAPQAVLARNTYFGVVRSTGGAFENVVLNLWVFGASGLVTRGEIWEPEHEAEALGRFDEIVGGGAPARTVRRVTPNAVTVGTEAFDAAFARGDATAFADLLDPAVVVLDHPTRSTYGRAGAVESFERLLGMETPRVRHEPLATLGASLALFRRIISATGSGGGRFDVGAFEREELVVSGGGVIEIFAADRLGDALVRFYERYAETVPEGVERARALAAARSLAATNGRIDLDALRTAYDPAFRCVDHRVFDTWSAGSAEDMVRHYGGQLDLAPDFAGRYDDVLAAGVEAVVVRMTFRGTGRDSGGLFENHLCAVFRHGADGRLNHIEVFEADQTAEALACFDALTGGAPRQLPGSVPPHARPTRPPRANAVTRVSAEFEALVATHDFAALETFFATDAECVDHPVGTTYGAAAMTTGMRRLMRSPDARLRFVPLATLGDSWGLVRREMSASGLVGRHFDMGAYEIVDVAVFGSDARGRLRDVELFAEERLGAAIVRLYERYADSLSDAPASARARRIARSLAALDGPITFDEIADANAPAVEVVDQRVLGTWSARGHEEWMTHWRGQLALADHSAARYEAVLALEPGAILVQQTYYGSSRSSGGAFENVMLVLHAFDADGRVVRTELFEPERVAAALARFDALTVDPAARPPARRRVHPNAATRTAAALEAAFARRDLAAVDALLGDPLETIEHPTATRYGREGQLESSRRMMRMPDLCFRIEPMATLGDALCLARRVVTASGTAGGRFDVGAYEIESIVLMAADAAGRISSSEVFASTHLCQAIARLYERYAESLPDGPERTRAAGTAAAHTVMSETLDAAHIGNAFAESYVCVDHRSLGTWSAAGRDEWMRHWREQAELAAGFSRRDEDVLALTPAVNVVRHTYFGTNRASGGPFENVILAVNVFDAAGRVVRAELFEPDQESEALARFDALVAGDPAEATAHRRVRATAATRGLARFAAVIAARDRDAVGDVFDESLHFTHHPTATTYGRREMIATWRSILKAERVTFRSEVLASLGETLALERHQLAIEGLSESHVAGFGLAEFDEIVVIETDERGRWIRTDLFDADHFGDAIARLYARHAELLPDGPLRERAAMTARVTATMLTRSTEYRLEDVSAPDFRAVDHRSVGIGTATGAGFWQRWRDATDELAQDQTYRIEDVLALGVDGLLRRTTEMGTVRASGGAFENGVWILSIFGPDGRQSRIELFDVGREAEALARYDALVGGSAELVTPAPSAEFFANAATRALDGVAHATEARDWARLADLMAASLHFDDRRPLFRMQLGKEGFLEQHRVLFDVPNARWVMTAIATRGEHLTLSRILLEGDVAGGGGALEIDHLGVIEVDADGRMTAIVLFEPGELDAAYAELDARYSAGEGAMHPPITSQFSQAIARRDWDAIAAMCGSGFVEQDHRSLALLGTSRDPETWVQNFRVQVELAPDTVARFEHTRPCPRGNLWTLTWEGSRDGGRYEMLMVGVTELDGQGKLARVDLWDPEQLDQARARFAELAAPAPSAHPFGNAATRLTERFERAWVARDWQAVSDLSAASMRFDDRRPLLRLELPRDGYVEQLRVLFDTPKARWTVTVVATRGERLALMRLLFQGDVAGGGGALEIDHLCLGGVGNDGRFEAIVIFEPVELAAAYAELDRRWQAGGAAHARVTAYQSAFGRGLADRDWNALAALHAPTLVAHDHRLVGWDVLRGPDAYVGALRAMVELAPDAQGRLDHLRTAERGFLAEVVWVGTRDGGAFESPFLWVVELDAAGRAARLDFYDPHHAEAARARFAEIERRALNAAVARDASHTARGAASAGRARRHAPFAALAQPTLVTAAMERWQAGYDAGFETGRWEAMRPLFAPGYVFDDRRRMVLLRGDIELMLASLRERAATGARPEWTVVGAAGERIVIGRVLWSGGPADGRFEIEYVGVNEADENGLIVANVLYDLADAAAARRDAWARFAAIDPVAAPWVELLSALIDAWDVRDLTALRKLAADDMVLEDHRHAGLGRIEGADAYGESLTVLWALAPDQRLEVGSWLAVDRHGFLVTARRAGTLASGGAFESEYLWLGVGSAGRFSRSEFFEIEDLEAARARFEELRG